MTEVPLGPGTPWPTYGRVFRYSAIAVATLSAPLLLWQLSDVVLLTVGAVLFATLLRLIGEPLEHWTPMPEWLRLLIAGLIVIAVIGGTGWLFGTQMASEFTDVTARVQSSLEQVKTELGSTDLGRYVMQRMGGTDVSVTSTARTMMSLGTSTLEGLIIILISAVYLVAQPRVYRDGIVLLFPPHAHRRVQVALDAIGQALRLWLMGQLTEMAIIGALTLAAAWLIGLPSIWALGVIAFVCEFIPYVGPIVAAVPAVLVALTRSPETALWTAAAYLLIHQIEGNLVTPLIQRWLIVIPPALMLIGIAAVSVLFGFAGVLFAGPIVVILFVGIRQIYVRDTLEEAL